MKICIVILITLFVVQGGGIMALDPFKPINLYDRSVFNIENGLPNNTVYSVTQSRDGYLWFGTLMGAVRFDGVAFDVFNSENTNAFTTDSVSRIITGRSGELWMSTHGSGIIAYKNGKFTALTTQDGLSHNNTDTLMEAGDGSLWIGTAQGLDHYINGKFIHVPLKSDTGPLRVRTLMEDRNGRIWSGTMGGGVFVTLRKGDRLETEHLPCVSGRTILEIIEDRMGRIWVASMEQGLFMLKGDKIRVYDQSNGLPVNYAHNIYEDHTGNILIGTYGGGLSVIPVGSQEVRDWNSQNLAGCHSVMGIFEDRQRNLWLATDTSGLICFRDTPITTYTRENGLSNSTIFGVFQDSRENIWCGTVGFGLNRMAPKKKKDHFVTLTKEDGLSSNSIHSFAEYPNGRIWIGSLGAGIMRMSLDTGEIDTMDSSDGLSDNFVFSLNVDRDDILWAGTSSGGLHRYIAKEDRFVQVDDFKRRLVVIHKDSKGNLWCGTSGNGLFLRRKPGAGHIGDAERNAPRAGEGSIPGRVRYGKTDGFRDERVVAVHEDPKGRMWFGTLSGGMNVLVPGTNRFRQLGKKDGLPANAVYSILPDKNHHLWLGTDNGIFCLFQPDIDNYLSGRTERLKPYRMGLTQGMKSKDCSGGNQPMAWKSRDGRFWFPTNNGLSVVNPENISCGSRPPQVVIKGVTADGQYHQAAKGRFMNLPPGNGNMAIEYTAPCSVAPGKIRFKYKLEGVDQQWVEAGTRRTAFYTLLPPGQYRFQVIAMGGNTPWSTAPLSLNFDLNAHFYQTGFFKIVSVICMLVLMLVGYHYVNRRLFLSKQKRAFNGKKLPENVQEEYLRKILYLFEVEKIYRDPNICVKTLSSKLITSARTVSFIINDQLKKTFFELTNHYRVKEAQEILVSPGQKGKSVMDIGYDVGFNSKSSFNRVFKNVTQMTPSQYRKKHKG